MYTTAVGTKRTPRLTEFGALIQAKRKSDGLSLRSAAGVVGIEHSGLSDLERGLRYPDFETIAKINERLGIPLDELARAAAHDLGFQPADTEEAYKRLAISLTSRAQAFPELRKILDHLARTDPAQYRAFLVMFQTWEQAGEQAGERSS